MICFIVIWIKWRRTLVCKDGGMKVHNPLDCYYDMSRGYEGGKTGAKNSSRLWSHSNLKAKCLDQIYSLLMEDLEQYLKSSLLKFGCLKWHSASSGYLLFGHTTPQFLKQRTSVWWSKNHMKRGAFSEVPFPDLRTIRYCKIGTFCLAGFNL